MDNIKGAFIGQTASVHIMPLYEQIDNLPHIVNGKVVSAKWMRSAERAVKTMNDRMTRPGGTA